MGIADGELTSMALCWRLERTDGAGIGLTSHDRALLRDGIRYETAPGMMPASVTRQLGLEPSSSEISGALSADAIDAGDLSLGRWDGATVGLTAEDWSEPSAEPIRLLAGEIGDVAIHDDEFTANLKGAAAGLGNAACPTTSAECRAQFGDKRCGVDLAGRSVIGAIVSASGNRLALDRPVDDRFVFGRARFLSGDNCGAVSIILSATGSGIVLRDLPRVTIEPGCRIELREGCDKRLETCVLRFGNAANFRGEPHLPGNDLLTRYPGA